MAGKGEQILIYSSHQLFLIHKCFINLTHDLKLEPYYNTDGNSFSYRTCTAAVWSSTCGLRDWRHFTFRYEVLIKEHLKKNHQCLFLPWTNKQINLLDKMCLQSYAKSTIVALTCLLVFHLILFSFPRASRGLSLKSTRHCSVTNKHESILWVGTLPLWTSKLSLLLRISVKLAGPLECNFLCNLLCTLHLAFPAPVFTWKPP